jgi:DNA-binding CsgD family transcriptional regulator
VAHGRAVLRHRGVFAPSVLVEVLERHAIECYTVGLGAEAAATQEDAVALRRELADPRALGVALRWLSRMTWWAGNRAPAEAAGAEAVEIFAGAGDEAGLALALCNQSQLFALAGQWDGAIAVGERAAAMARNLGDPGLLSHALNNVGLASGDSGRAAAQELLEESLRVALDAREIEQACRAYTNLSWFFIGELRFGEALDTLADATDLAEEAEFDGFLRYLHVSAGIAHLARAAWDDAERDAAWGMDASPPSRCPALYVTGRARVRRGDTAGEPLISEAFDIAVRLGEAQRLGPAGAVLIEAGWLGGDASGAAARVLPWFDEVFRRGHRGVAAELAYWLRVAGHEVAVVEVDHPYAHLAAGRWRQAAAAWVDCPYERALALSQSPDAGDVLAALSILDGIGAVPLARMVRSRLRDLGVARVPRGPASSTRDNPAGLTDRQVQVLRLLADGLTNAEIASRLVLSVRTVDTHVATILGKLEVPTRRDAARRATDLGLLGGSRQ